MTSRTPTPTEAAVEAGRRFVLESLGEVGEIADCADRPGGSYGCPGQWFSLSED